MAGLASSPSHCLGSEGAGLGGVVWDGKWTIDSDLSHATADSALTSPLLPLPIPSPPRVITLLASAPLSSPQF